MHVLACAACATRFSSDRDPAGRRFRCPRCGVVNTMPGDSGLAAPPVRRRAGA